MPQNAWIIAALPLLSYVLTVLIGRRLGEKAALIGITAMGLATLLALVNLFNVINGAEAEGHISWLRMGDWEITMGFQMGPVEASVVAMVTLVSWMIFLFSKGYMHGDRRFNRFFAHISLFVAGMLTLVMSDNILLFFVAWEIMGVCSYLLIGHWFEEVDNARAAFKAFIVTRIGDVGFMLGIWLLAAQAGSFNFRDILPAVAGMDPGLVTLAALLLFVGAVGKSAQVPLHIWLPDAMAGPTPVSALIHAATMVAAGVFLVGRMFPVFEASNTAMTTVAFTGAITALVAALIATVQTDIKKALAYSTMSQLGFMMLALGVGSFAAGIFHMESHAFFKALLFLGSGSVIHAVHTQEMHKMGGLLSPLRITGLTFIIGTLALAGIPPFAGFYSKDAILAGAYASDYPILFWIALFAAFLTAYYMTRVVALTFFGKPRDEKAHAHADESPRIMTAPLMVLAVPAVLFGLAGAPFTGHAFQSFITEGHAAEEEASIVPLLAMGLAAAGILLGWLIYGAGVLNRQKAIRALKPLYVLFKEKFFFDHLGLAIARLTVGLATAVGAFDRYVVDGIVNGVAWVTLQAGRGARALTMGSAQGYALFMFAGIVVMLLVYQLMGKVG